MAMQAATVLEDGLKRDVAILSTLAHLHCATVSQLHALCFPFHTLATARLTLHFTCFAAQPSGDLMVGMASSLPGRSTEAMPFMH